MNAEGINCIGIDPTEALVRQARQLDSSGDYVVARAEALPFANASFDLVISCLSLIDIKDFRCGIAEMNRVVAPGGAIIVANLNSFNTAGQTMGWMRDDHGERLHYPVDNYLSEHSDWVEWAGIRIRNWHRPLSAYMQAFLSCGLELRFFDEPRSLDPNSSRTEIFDRAPYFVVMKWGKPAAPK